MGAADMVIIGTGRDDPRQWVKVAYAVNDAIQCGQTGPTSPAVAGVRAARRGERSFRQLILPGVST